MSNDDIEGVENFRRHLVFYLDDNVKELDNIIFFIGNCKNMKI